MLSTRLREVLREELGGTYSASANVHLSFHPANEYAVKVRFSCDPKRAEELSKAAWTIIDSLKSEPVESSYTIKLSAQQRKAKEVEKKQNAYWQNVLVGNRRRGEKTADLVGYWTLHETLTPTLIREAAQRYLNAESQIQITLLPESVNLNSKFISIESDAVTLYPFNALPMNTVFIEGLIRRLMDI